MIHTDIFLDANDILNAKAVANSSASREGLCPIVWLIAIDEVRVERTFCSERVFFFLCLYMYMFVLFMCNRSLPSCIPSCPMQPFVLFVWRKSHRILQCIVKSMNDDGVFDEPSALAALAKLGAELGDIERIIVVRVSPHCVVCLHASCSNILFQLIDQSNMNSCCRNRISPSCSVPIFFMGEDRVCRKQTYAAQKL